MDVDVDGRLGKLEGSRVGIGGPPRPGVGLGSGGLGCTGLRIGVFLMLRLSREKKKKFS